MDAKIPVMYPLSFHIHRLDREEFVVKRSFLPGLLFVILLAGSATATEDDFGLGIIIGEPTGFSGKLWTSSTTAVDGAIAWSFNGDNALHLHADYLTHRFNLIHVDQGRMAVHFGIGGRLKFDDDDSFGIRFPVGLTYMVANSPFDVFLEVVPLLDIAPDTEFNPNAAIGMRYFFGTARKY